MDSRNNSVQMSGMRDQYDQGIGKTLRMRSGSETQMSIGNGAGGNNQGMGFNNI